MTIKLYNSLTKQNDELKPIRKDEVSIYSCGPTVYNYAHIGNMRAFLFADLLQRTVSLLTGLNIKWVMNITDIDDKTIRDSKINSENWNVAIGQQTDEPKTNLRMLTDYYLKLFIEDISALGIREEHFYKMPRATDYIIQMQELIRKIYTNGFAYVSEGSIYFNVSKWREIDTYGKLKNIDFTNFKAGSRIDADEYEREQVSDFVLWKAPKEDEPIWDFELDNKNYPGRPGWHIECSAMGADLLGLPFDIHTGGVDLKFPHHEDEIAQSKAAFGVEPVNLWCHNEFLEVENKKMSKSLGNYFTLRDLLNKGLDPLDIRFSMLSAHYRSKFNFTFKGLEAASKSRKRIQDLIISLNSVTFDNNDNDSQEIEQLQELIYEELANDLHTPKVLAHLFSFVNNMQFEKLSANEAKKLKILLSNINSVFAVWDMDKIETEAEIPSEIISLAEKRLEAKISKNWSLADELRNKISELGYIITDTKTEYKISKK